MSSGGDFQFDELFISSSPQHSGNSPSGNLMYILGTKTEDIGNEEDVDIEEEENFEADGADVSIANKAPEFVDEAHKNNLRESVTLSTTINVGSFTVHSLVGKGAYGKVRQVVHKDTKVVYAMKSLHKKHLIETNCVENTMAEKDVLRKISHPFIVRLHYAFQTSSKLYLIMDFINGGHLLHHLSREFRFSEHQARFYLAEVILAIEHLHSLNVIHRDLKPENVLIGADGHCVLTDFGFAKEDVIEHDSCKSFCGTLEYMAPEVVKKSRYGKPADWWSVGILLYDMLMGHPPFQHNNDAKLYTKILNDKLVLPNYFTDGCCKLLRGLLERNVNKRLNVQQIKGHFFFKGLDWKKVGRKELSPPFIPVVVDGELDTSNFDKDLTKLAHGESPCASPLSNSLQAKFMGFSYVRSSFEHFRLES